MKEMNVSAGEAVVRLLEEGNQAAILQFGSEDDLIKILQHPSASIACDCGASLPTRGSHPRNYGTYPRVLGHYVRERKALTWQDAVRKMTLLPAVTVGMIDRGAIAVGMAADITVFDPATVIDHATYDEPALSSEGIRYVIVNGTIALRDGKPTSARGGQVLRRAKYMPSRAMSPPGRRRVVADGDLSVVSQAERLRVKIDVSQDRGARGAKGVFRVTNLKGDLVLEGVEFGLLQSAGGWATFTVRARTARDESVPESGVRVPSNGSADFPMLTVVVDRADPWQADRGSSITIIADRSFEAAGRGVIRIDGR
jgi:N-acyl-D-amino-acid deacylase